LPKKSKIVIKKFLAISQTYPNKRSCRSAAPAERKGISRIWRFTFLIYYSTERWNVALALADMPC